MAIGELSVEGSVCPGPVNDGIPVYRDTAATVEERVEDLLSRMTLEEKVGQMNQFVGLEHIRRNEAHLTEEDLKNNTAQAFYPGFSADSVAEWTRKGLVGSFLHVLTIEEANSLQSLAMESRLGIPVIFGIDAIHGNANAPDNTVYPTNIGLAGTFDPELAYRIARETAAEMRAMNMHWTFNPNVEVARDARWGRVGETFGEDPYLVSLMGAETVKGYQGDLSSDDVLACIKHFVCGSQPVNGTNGSPADLSERTIREVFFPPFKSGVEAGAMSLMTAHNELNGVPCHANGWLMEDVLRNEWDFKGFVVSDWMDIEHIYDLHATAENLKEAFFQSIMAGMDMHMHGVYWNEYVCDLVREGRIPESRIDQSVRRILSMKFRLGLFEHPYADPAKTMEIRLCEAHRQTALEAARKSVVLLKNDGLLPLDASRYRKVLVTGINADDHNILGDWSAEQKPENVITVVEGLRMVSPETEFIFADQGWDPRNMSRKNVDKAASLAKKCDLNIVVAGEYMYRGRWTERTSGEDTDRSDIDLVGLQNELIRKVAASGKPTVLILVSGRPLGVQWAADKLPALVNAWEPGMYGGQAIAEILYGKVNPSAKLAISIPRSAGQIQMIYNHKPSQYFHPYAVTPSTPLFPFGFGLSYTEYSYSDLRLDKTEIPAEGTAKVSVTVTNKGRMAGDEIVQLYIRDRFSSVTRPVKELKDFARIHLEPGESRVVEFYITPDKLSFLDKNMRTVVEPGEFIIMTGPSSEDRDLLKTSLYVVSSSCKAGQSAEYIKQIMNTASSERKIMYGHQDALMYGHCWKAARNGEDNPAEGMIAGLDKSDTKDVCGSHPAVLGFDLGGIELGNRENIDGCPFDLMRQAAVLHSSRGGIVTFSWHMRNPLTGGDSWDVSSGETVASVLEGGSCHEKFMEWLEACADFISSIRDSEGRVIPVIFRPWHEHTGSWFWWGQDLCSREQYVSLWKMTWKYMTETRGLGNIVWAYSPGAGPDKEGYMERYPGDNTVDLLGLDCYQFGSTPEAYREQLVYSLSFIKELASSHGKLMALTETGFEGIPDPDWWTDVLYPAIKNSGIAYVLTWRNAWDRPGHFYSAFPGAVCEADFKAFCSLPDIILLDSMENVSSGLTDK